jgi:hypothetical protein
MRNFIPGNGLMRRNGRSRRGEIFIIFSEHVFALLKGFAHAG